MVAGIATQMARLSAAAAPSTDTARNASTDKGEGQIGIMFFAGLDWSVPMFFTMMFLVLRAVWGEGALQDYDTQEQTKVQRDGRVENGNGHHSAKRLNSTMALPYWGQFLVGCAFFHSFVVTILGVQDLGGANMYSNLRMQGGSNHILSPTALLHKWFGSISASRSVFGGGIVRIEESDSQTINRLYPGEITSTHSVRARELLVGAGHSG